MRRGQRRRGTPSLVLLPPAIRPGLHCGAAVRSFSVTLRLAFPRPSGRGSIAALIPMGRAWIDDRLPPAIRPGLHCGRLGLLAVFCRTPIVFPRPSGRGSIAAANGSIAELI